MPVPLALSAPLILALGTQQERKRMQQKRTDQVLALCQDASPFGILCTIHSNTGDTQSEGLLLAERLHPHSQV